MQTFVQLLCSEAFIKIYWLSLPKWYFKVGVSRSVLVRNRDCISDGKVRRLDHFLLFLFSLMRFRTKMRWLSWYSSTFTFLILVVKIKMSFMATGFLVCLHVEYCGTKWLLKLEGKHRWWRLFRSDFCSETLRSKTSQKALVQNRKPQQRWTYNGDY
jgi:hypothetical protein